MAQQELTAFGGMIAKSKPIVRIGPRSECSKTSGLQQIQEFSPAGWGTGSVVIETPIVCREGATTDG